jgi:NTP pyrophosphatase (non-canonical NTP hydrolase)
MDGSTTIHELKKTVADFRDSRNWRKYDTPRNLATSISIEAAELLEHFQWKTEVEVDKMIRRKEKLEDIAGELADVLIYCLGFSDTLKIDVSQAVRSKLEKNAKKYPART